MRSVLRPLVVLVVPLLLLSACGNAQDDPATQSPAAEASAATTA